MIRQNINPTTPFDELPVWLFLKEACDYLGRSHKATLDIHSRGGKLPFAMIKKGGRWMVHKNQLAEPTIERKFR